MSAIPVVQIDTDDPRALALAMAVMHHGLANLAERSVPSRAETVLDTAQIFEDHLNGQPRRERERSRRH